MKTSGFVCRNLTSSISETEIGEPPHVTETDCVTDDGEEKVQLAAPLLPLGLISSLCLASLSRGQVGALWVVKYVFELKQRHGEPGWLAGGAAYLDVSILAAVNFSSHILGLNISSF